MSAYLAAHPLLWLVIVAFVGLLVLRVVAKLACLAVLVIAGLIIESAVLGVLGRII